MLAAAASAAVLPNGPAVHPWEFWLQRVHRKTTLGPTPFPSTQPTPTLDVKPTVNTPVPTPTGGPPPAVVAPAPTSWASAKLFTVGGVTVSRGTALAVGGVLAVLWLAARKRR